MNNYNALTIVTRRRGNPILCSKLLTDLPADAAMINLRSDNVDRTALMLACDARDVQS